MTLQDLDGPHCFRKCLRSHMRWLLIVLLVSLAALLIAAFGVARHILLHRDRLRSKRASDLASGAAPVPGKAPITEVETEI